MVAQKAPAPPVTTIVPFNDQALLPACAAACGPLYDGNGGCVPPAIPEGPKSNYEACFCANPKVAGLQNGAEQVCPDACPNDPDGLKSISVWYSNLCKTYNKAPPPKTTSTAGSGSSDSSKGSGKASHDNGDWISNHYQWVIMIVVLVVGIAAIWIGACIWRRRYLRKKQRQSTTDQKHSGSTNHPSWGPPLPNSESGIPMTQSSRSGLPTFENKATKTKSKWGLGRRS